MLLGLSAYFSYPDVYSVKYIGVVVSCSAMGTVVGLVCLRFINWNWRIYFNSGTFFTPMGAASGAGASFGGSCSGGC